MRPALLLVTLAACAEPAIERLERDALLGAVETGGYRFTSAGGLLHVREASADRLVLRASCDELSFELERKSRDLELLTVELENVAPSLTLTGPVERVPLENRWVVRFPPGVDRVEITAPPQPPSDFTFLAFGDIQTGIRNFDDVIAQLNEHRDADFILFLGDATNDSTVEEFEAVEEAWSRIALPIFATPGNHDVFENVRYQQRFGRTSYTCTHKGARFTSVDSSSATLAEALWPKLEGWLDQGRSQLHVVFTHVPATEVLGVRSGQWNARREARQFTAAAVDAKVDLMLFGHIHSFDAYSLGGIPTYISGGGGALPERLDGIDRHFLKVHVTGGVPDVEVVRVDPMRLLAVLALTSCGSAAVPVPFGQPSDGIITYYDGDGSGACGYDPTGDDFAAISTPQWAGSASCGTCVEVTGPKGVVVVRVVDRCPECPAGHFDLRRTSFAKVADLPDGRVSMSWRTVTCPTSGNLRLQLKDGSNPYWVAIQVRNHRRPVAKLEGKKDGAWKELPRADYNYFLEESGLGAGPVDVRVTADDGTVVSATIQSVQPNIEIPAAGQF